MPKPSYFHVIDLETKVFNLFVYKAIIYLFIKGTWSTCMIRVKYMKIHFIMKEIFISKFVEISRPYGN